MVGVGEGISFWFVYHRLVLLISTSSISSLFSPKRFLVLHLSVDGIIIVIQPHRSKTLMLFVGSPKGHRKVGKFASTDRAICRQSAATRNTWQSLPRPFELCSIIYQIDVCNETKAALTARFYECSPFVRLYTVCSVIWLCRIREKGVHKCLRFQ